jgi:hypothetical protein
VFYNGAQHTEHPRDLEVRDHDHHAQRERYRVDDGPEGFVQTEAPTPIIPAPPRKAILALSSLKPGIRLIARPP